MSESILENIVKFLERTPVTGLECLAWCQAYAYIKSEIDKSKNDNKEGAQ